MLTNTREDFPFLSWTRRCSNRSTLLRRERTPLSHTHTLTRPQQSFVVAVVSAVHSARAPIMSNVRRVPPPAVYSQVPSSPPRQAPFGAPRSPLDAATQRHPSYGHSYRPVPEDTAQSVQTGAIGSGYGPYSVCRSLLSSSSVSPSGCLSSSSTQYRPDSVRGDMYRESHFSAAPSEQSSLNGHEKGLAAGAATSTVPPYLWDAKDPDLDDPLHNPDPIRDAALDRKVTFFSWRGWANASVLFIIVVGLLALFIGLPVVADQTRSQFNVAGFNLGGINASGQIPDLPNFPTLIDKETPQSAYTKRGSDGKTYSLVFSDEFNIDGRTFYPGDDPYWEAPDFHYWPTGDIGTLLRANSILFQLFLTRLVQNGMTRRLSLPRTANLSLQ